MCHSAHKCAEIPPNLRSKRLAAFVHKRTKARATQKLALRFSLARGCGKKGSGYRRRSQAPLKAALYQAVLHRPSELGALNGVMRAGGHQGNQLAQLLDWTRREKIAAGVKIGISAGMSAHHS